MRERAFDTAGRKPPSDPLTDRSLRRALCLLLLILFAVNPQPATLADGMGDSANPLVPAGYDIVCAAVSVLLVVLLVVALVSIARTANRLTSFQALIWVLVADFVPIVKPVAWLAIGRRSVPAQAQVGTNR